MAATFETSVSQLLEGLDKSVNTVLRDAIKAKLMAEAEKVVEEFAQQLADGIETRVHHLREPMSGDINVIIQVRDKQIPRRET